MTKFSVPMLSKDWDTLTKQLAKPKSVPTVMPTAIPLGKIKQWPGAFQHRGRRGNDGEFHVRELAASIRRSSTRTLAAVEVWWDGRQWACIDGHHRLDAYAAEAVGHGHPVPVAVFSGTLEQAIGRAAAANTKNKLRMPQAEKSNTAWRLVTTTSMSKAMTASVSDTSESTVAAMRKAHAALLKRSEGVGDLEIDRVGDLRDLTWTAAKALAAGQELDDFDRKTADEDKAQQMAKAIAQALGREGAKYPQILARALDIYDSRLMDALVDWWGSHDDDETEPDEPPAEVVQGL